MNDPDAEDPIGVVDDIAENVFHLCANLESRMNDGEQMNNEEVASVVARLKDYAGDLQLAASRLK